jgi:hypothetical protein
LYKPKEYRYRYIYYDPQKEAQKERLKKEQERQQAVEAGEYKPTIRRGTFKEMAQKNTNLRREQIRQSNIRLLIILSVLLIVVYYLIT